MMARSLWVGLLALALPTLVQAGTPTASKPAVRIVEAEFGLLSGLDTLRPTLTPTRTVPLVEGQQYGWRLKVNQRKTQLRWRESFTLPAAPQTWGETPGSVQQHISADQLTSVTERTEVASTGYLYNFWAVAPGDPAGHYVIKVSIDNGPTEVFEFDVVAPSETAPQQ